MRSTHSNKDQELTVTLERVTPEIASDFLAANTHNRNCSPLRVRLLATDIIKDNWVVNGDALRFDDAGNLIDGQHRLNAVVLANKAIDTMVIRGLDPETFSTMDTGKARNAGDALSVVGVDYPSVTAGVFRMFVASDRLSPDWDGELGRRGQLSNLEALALAEDFPEIAEGVARMHKPDRARTRKLLSPTAACFAYFAMNSIDHDDAEQFFTWLEYGEDMKRDNPVATLRYKLGELAAQRQDRGKEYKRKVMALVFKAWNLVRDGKTATNINWLPTQAFPNPE